jgi:hypothetical protein
LNAEHLANRALRRELLIARAAAERAALGQQLDQFGFRTQGIQGVARLAADGLGWARTAAPLAAAGSTVRYLRERPWLLSSGVALATRLARSRTFRWIAAAAVVGVAVWIFRRALTAGGEPEADTAEADPTISRT